MIDALQKWRDEALTALVGALVAATELCSSGSPTSNVDDRAAQLSSTALVPDVCVVLPTMCPGDHGHASLDMSQLRLADLAGAKVLPGTETVLNSAGSQRESHGTYLNSGLCESLGLCKPCTRSTMISSPWIFNSLSCARHGEVLEVPAEWLARCEEWVARHVVQWAAAAPTQPVAPSQGGSAQTTSSSHGKLLSPPLPGRSSPQAPGRVALVQLATVAPLSLQQLFSKGSSSEDCAHAVRGDDHATAWMTQDGVRMFLSTLAVIVLYLVLACGCLQHSASCRSFNLVSLQTYVLQNKYLRILFDACGRILSLFDREFDRELVLGTGVELPSAAVGAQATPKQPTPSTSTALSLGNQFK
jgi:hypothetical protein